jgi:hypothetical protein
MTQADNLMSGRPNGAPLYLHTSRLVLKNLPEK